MSRDGSHAPSDGHPRLRDGDVGTLAPGKRQWGFKPSNRSDSLHGKEQTEDGYLPIDGGKAGLWQANHPDDDLDDDQGDAELDLDFDPKKSSQKTLMHPNALRLHLDEPTAPPSHRRLSASSQLSNNLDAQQLAPSATMPSMRSPRVRFRSRVRITSGLHRSKHDPTSLSSSPSGSPSSSISAPLRSQSDDSAPWGPLGQRVNFLAWQKNSLGAPEQQRRQQQRRSSFGPWAPEEIDERTPLNAASRAYLEDDPFEEDDEADEDDAARLSREVDLVFGKWPGRLLNHHWWMWQIEPVVCCHCIEESDSEE